MKTTIKVLQLPHQTKKDGTCPILFRLTQGRKSKYIKTGYSVKPYQFKEGLENWVVKHPDALLINAAIESKRSAMMENIIHADIENHEVDMNSLLDRKHTSNKTVLGVVTQLRQNYEDRKQVAAFNRIKTNIDYLKEAWGKDIMLDELNRQWVEKYANYRFKLGNTASTVKKNLSDIAVALNRADYDGRNHFADYAKTIKPVPVQREKLTIEELKMLENVQLEGLADVARDMFLFSFYCHGMRYESVATFDLKTIRGNSIIYRMNKGQKIREIEIHPKLKAIINKYKQNKSLYLFPVVKKKHDEWTKKEIVNSTNVLMNTYLNRAAILAGINRHIHFHLARHTFATIGLQKGMSLEVLKDSLGHSKFTTTVQYAKSLSDEYINKAVRDLGVFD